MEMQSLDIDQAADTANEVNADTRAEIRLKVGQLLNGATFLQFIPPENYKPIAAAIMLAVLDNRAANGWSDTVVMQILMSRLLQLLYIGDQPDSPMLLHAIWRVHDMFAIINPYRTQLVDTIRTLVNFPSPPAKKKGGRKSKKNKQRFKRRRSKSHR